MMRFDTSQQMKLGQQMKLAPRMIQSMEILQLPAMALQERIEQELESNIALEQVEPNDDLDLDHDRTEAEDRDAVRDERLERRELVVGDESSGQSEDFERLSVFESTYGEAFENTYSSDRPISTRLNGERDRKMDAMANVAARGESLVEQLLHQWSFADVDPDTARIGEHIIGYIGKDGLLEADLQTILEQSNSLASTLSETTLTIEKLEEVLNILQHTLEPPGVAARNQRECLLLQAEARAADAPDDENWEQVQRLIRDHLTICFRIACRRSRARASFRWMTFMLRCR
jgi:RNA polymerase sigma-54 factor